MTEATDLDLDDYVDLPTAASLSDIFTRAKADATTPKPTLQEMIEAVTMVRYELEDGQERLVATGASAEPYKPAMRRAAVLASCANFLSLIAENQAAVANVLRGHRR